MAILKGQIQDASGDILHPETEASQVLTSASDVQTELNTLNKQALNYVVATGTANTYAVSVSGVISYYDGLRITAKINVASTGSSTLNVNGLGAKIIKDSLGNTITSGGLKANMPYTFCYESTSGSFILLGKGGGGNVTADKILAPYTATSDSGPVVGTIPTIAAATITPGTTNQVIASGKYIGGNQTILGDSKLVSSNIKSGISIFGVSGSTSVVDTSAGTVNNNNQLLSGYKCYSDGVLYTGSIASKAAATYTPGTTNQTIAAGLYTSGVQTILGDPELIAANIKSGITIFGIGGTFTDDATATASKMLSGETAYISGTKITGNIPSKGAATYTPGTTNQTIAAGQYISGVQTIEGDADLKAENIVDGINIFGITGSATPVSLGGAYFDQGEFSSGGTYSVSGLSFTPNVVIIRHEDITDVITTLSNFGFIQNHKMLKSNYFYDDYNTRLNGNANEIITGTFSFTSDGFGYDPTSANDGTPIPHYWIAMKI